MTLPTFLGIGVPKAGTTWLYKLLANHPDVFVSKQVTELGFFNHRFDNGQAWYESFFPNDREAAAYRALGEISPGYLYCEACPQRIAEMIPGVKLILLLRDPVDRAWSHYLFRVRLDNYQKDFEQFLSDYPYAIERGFYAEHIRNYLRYFDLASLLVLIFDQVFTDIPRARTQLADFLEINPAEFSSTAGFAKVNQGFVPRFGQAYAYSTRVLGWAVRRQQYWAINLAKKLGLKRALRIGAKTDSRSMEPGTRHRLQSLYSQDILELEDLLGIDLSHWREYPN